MAKRSKYTLVQRDTKSQQAYKKMIPSERQIKKMRLFHIYWMTMCFKTALKMCWQRQENTRT